MLKVKERLYNLLGQTASVFFNILNLLMAGNLPPFGSVYVMIKEQERYLMLETPNGKAVLPGGFMRWREDPLETGRRECEEETGMQVRMLDLLGYLSCPSKSRSHMSTLTLVYRAEIIGGHLRGSVEGHPIWISETEAKQRLPPRYQPFFESHARDTHQQTDPSQGEEQKTSESIVTHNTTS
ncbi:MAG: NUDIX hydrolase [Ktedonobacteraceae bacterium]